MADSDLTTDSVRPAASSSGGSVSMTTTRDLQLGGAGRNNDVDAKLGVTLAAGRDVTINQGTDVVSNTFSSTTAEGTSVQADRDLNIDDGGTGDATVGSARPSPPAPRCPSGREGAAP